MLEARQESVPDSDRPGNSPVARYCLGASKSDRYGLETPPHWLRNPFCHGASSV
jgi:hypothetical protein